jgi:hypothetical protein
MYELQNNLVSDKTYKTLQKAWVLRNKHTHTRPARLVDAYNFSQMIDRLLKIACRLLCIFIDLV